MISILAALLLAAPAAPADPPAQAPTVLASTSAPKPPADIRNAVDANGVPAWAKRKHMKPVQNCTSRPNIAVDTWRDELDPNSKVGAPRPVPIKTTCK
ncbi:MAG TPA: hypothetical protein VF495_06395 [Phenylobacterium sp.]|jgi:hypothetical protein